MVRVGRWVARRGHRMSHCAAVNRELIPGFDLYGELEVSRSASGEVIEAAYRALVKNHHPDVALPEDRERITRLNLAREWLTEPSRRRRYDAAFPPGSNWAGTGSTTGRSSAASRPGGTARPMHGRPPEEAWAPPPPQAGPGGFGVNSPEIRQFLADLRALDAPRAVQMISGKSVAEVGRYANARQAALIASRMGRHDEWAFAREAASVIAKGKLGDTRLSEEIAAMVADIAGAIVVRDLITPAQFELLLLPWMWRPTPRGGAAAARGGSTKGASASKRSIPRPSMPRPSMPNVSMPRLPSVSRPSLPKAGMRSSDLPNSGLPGSGSTPDLARVRGGRPSALRRATSPILVGIVAIAFVGGAVLLLNRPPGSIIAVGGETALPTPPDTTAVPTPADIPTAPPTAAPSVAPTPVGSIDPAQLPALRNGVAATIRNLTEAAALGNIVAAQELLGASAPELQASGLRNALFPEVTPSQILVARTGNGFLATVGADRLTSTDGTTWTFDYGDRPLAFYGRSAERDVYWIEPDGRHDLFLRVGSATISKTGIRVRMAWTYHPERPEDRYYRDATIVVSSLRFGSRAVPLTEKPTATIDPAVRTVTLTVLGTFEIPRQILVQVTISPRLGAGGGTTVRTISTVFELREG